MRLLSLVSLIGGELKNSPAISTITGFTSHPASVKRGSLFFAKDKSQVSDAIANGAYAIVYEGWIQRSDEEIAWIKVNSLLEAVQKLIRFLLIKNQAHIITLSPLGLELAQIVIQDEKIAFFQNSYFDFLEQYHTQEFVAAPKEFALQLALDNTKSPIATIKVIQERLFETTFIYRGKFYARQRISPLFLQEFQEVLGLIDMYNFFFDFSHLKDFPHFHPHFLERDFTECEFGTSDRVIITEPDITLLPRESIFLQEKAPWAQLLFFCFSCNLKTFDTIKIDGVKNFLYNRRFNYALCEEFDIKTLAKQQQQKTLF
ncbi:protoporphyrin/coproporphyrin ferrochelatase [Nitratiruptor sp. YY08-26]|uniref:hypothetical protein n=1 Tax=unclassified Nitratiruptor TaxID=2624044 RepID=UPI001915A09B|nr:MULTISPECIES: hypothetical protein [unclassified Nitratiruptor]BCD62146.1 protoporphyrin/coproporphyrin ferrochelatase [Nitratiruptor sp. YY08-13]BCD66082.1 protoporphyrin/coproporphyrin ferrochelatase [Nitratiruptor sp. YY08-26]